MFSRISLAATRREKTGRWQFAGKIQDRTANSTPEVQTSTSVISLDAPRTSPVTPLIILRLSIAVRTAPAAAAKSAAPKVYSVIFMRKRRIITKRKKAAPM